ncbi:MAG: hypothetical protein V7603_5187 [Micromonosporaceae bacterium]
MSEDFTRRVLQVAADATAPLGRFDIAEAINPGPHGLTEDAPEYEAFATRRIDIIRTAVRLEQEGLLECVTPATGEQGDLLRISAAGRDRLQNL